MKAIYEDHGSQQLTVGELKNLLRSVPDDAKITSIQATNTQTDGWVWSFRAEGAPAPRPGSGMHYPPGVRGAQ